MLRMITDPGECMIGKCNPWITLADMDPATLSTLRQADRQFHLHPFTNHSDMHRAGTFIVTGAEGCFVIDEQGRQLLDGLAGLWCVNVGYGRREIVDAV